MCIRDRYLPDCRTSKLDEVAPLFQSTDDDALEYKVTASRSQKRTKPLGEMTGVSGVGCTVTVTGTENWEKQLYWLTVLAEKRPDSRTVMEVAFCPEFHKKLLVVERAVSYTHLDVYKRQVRYVQIAKWRFSRLRLVFFLCFSTCYVATSTE